MLNMKHIILYLVFVYVPGVDPGFFLVGGALGGGGVHPLHPPPRAAPAYNNESKKIQAQQFIKGSLEVQNIRLVAINKNCMVSFKVQSWSLLIMHTHYSLTH